MIVLESGDKIQGDATAATVVDYSLHGLDNNVLKQLADGQLAGSIGDIYTADSTDIVKTIILVNTDSAARSINLYITPNAGTARRLIPKDLVLGVGYSLHTDGEIVTIMSPTGGILSSYVSHASSHTDGGDDIQDATNAVKGLATASQITSLELTRTGSIPSLAPVTGTAAGFAANFTGSDLYGGTYIVDTAGTCQLPSMLEGMNFTIITLGDIAVVVDTDVDDGYLMDGVTNAEGKNITNLSTSGDIAVFQYYTADDWLITTNGWTPEA